MHKLVAFLLVSAVSVVAFGYSDVKELPRPARWVRVTDPKHLIAADQTRILDEMLESHRVKTTNQIAVVVVDKIEAQTPKQFATALFRSWQIGEKGKDNGLLILMSIGDRRVEFETGYGLEGILPDVTCKRIQMEAMVPEFKKGHYGNGLIAGVARAIAVLEGRETSAAPVETTPEPIATPYRGFADGGRVHIRDAVRDPSFWTFMIFGMGFPFWIYLVPLLLFVGWRLLFRRNLDSFPNAQQKYDYLATHTFPKWSMFVFPLPVIFLRNKDLRVLEELRRRPQLCDLCHSPMRLLSETEDDQHLSQGQQVEELVKSVDHDVYVCDRDRQIRVFHARTVGSSYENCPKCKALTYKLEDDRVIVPATYYASGQGVSIYRCASCAYEFHKKYTIPQKSRGRSGGSSGSSSSGGGGYSGGGRSGGGGAGSSW